MPKSVKELVLIVLNLDEPIILNGKRITLKNKLQSLDIYDLIIEEITEKLKIDYYVYTDLETLVKQTIELDITYKLYLHEIVVYL